MKLTTQLHLVPRSKNAWSSVKAQELLYLYLSYYIIFSTLWDQIWRYDGSWYSSAASESLLMKTPAQLKSLMLFWALLHCLHTAISFLVSTCRDPDIRCTNFSMSPDDLVKQTYTFPSLRTGRSEFDSLQGQGIFLATASRSALGSTQPPIQWVPGTLSPGVKRPGPETDHSRPSSPEVKNAWNYTSTPQYVPMTWCLVKYRTRLHGVILS
jgi:hypothetical protein